jgi:hypothetical protein
MIPQTFGIVAVLLAVVGALIAVTEGDSGDPAGVPVAPRWVSRNLRRDPPLDDFPLGNERTVLKRGS